MAEDKYTSSYTGKKIDEAIQSVAEFPNKITDLNNEIAANKAKISTQESAIKKITNDIEELRDNTEAEQIAELSGKVDSQASQITTLTTAITETLPDAIDKVERSLGSYKTETNKKIKDLESKINDSGSATDIESTVQNNTAQINDLNQTVNGQAIKIASLQEQAKTFATDAAVITVVADVEKLKNDVNTIQQTDFVVKQDLNSYVTTNDLVSYATKADLDTFTNNINSINSNIETIDDTITAFDERFDNYVLTTIYEAKIVELTEQISALQGKCKELEDKINTPSE